MGDRLATIDMGRRVGAAVPLSCWELGLDLTQRHLGRGPYLRTKWHFDPSNRLATIQQRYRQTDRTGQTEQRYLSVGRTIRPICNGRPRPKGPLLFGDYSAAVQAAAQLRTV